MLNIKNIQKKYTGFTLNCTLSVRPGTITGLLGTNGAGKTTTFKSILNLITPDSGEIELFNKPCNSLTSRDKERIGTVLGGAGLYGSLTILQIAKILKQFYRDFEEAAFIENCTLFQLPLQKKTADFSTGMKARLHILIALSHNADLLILDEPTAGLDALAREDILHLLRTYMETGNRAILISSHISTDLENFCDDIYLLKQGEVLIHEDSDTLTQGYGILKLDEESYQSIDHKYLLFRQKETYGYKCLTNNREFFLDNYPDMVIEKNTLDELLTISERGESICVDCY